MAPSRAASRWRGVAERIGGDRHVREHGLQHARIRRVGGDDAIACRIGGEKLGRQRRRLVARQATMPRGLKVSVFVSPIGRGRVMRRPSKERAWSRASRAERASCPQPNQNRSVPCCRRDSRL